MKQVNNKNMKKLIIIVIFVFLGYYFIPNIYHHFLLQNTSEDTIKANRSLYNDYANSLNLNNNNEIEYREKMDSLYLWFHVRGLPIDEDHYTLTKLEQWKEIINNRKRTNTQ